MGSTYDPYGPSGYAAFGPMGPSGRTASSTMNNNGLEIGDRVELVVENCPAHYFDSQSMGSLGTVLNCAHGAIEVKWDSGHLNVYTPSQVSKFDMAQKKKDKKPTVVDVTKLDSLVLDAAAKGEIVAVLKQHQNHDKLFNEWGLGETIEYGKGMTFMFYGPPGTGKTWGANCIAKALGKELLVISAADIQSSEPGAANRSIKQAFATAKSKGQVLFMDECDSLITSRADIGMVLASEVNTLLTEIEKFEGVAILATNRIETMDEALERRISLIVEFPFPTEAQRREIWAKLLPKKLPLDKEVHIEDLAKLELSGGQIKNVILQAARIALGSEENAVKPEHFKAAIARIKKSKNLMGSASRYRQTVIQDYGVRTSKTTSVDKFLDIDEDITTDVEKGI